MNLYDIAKTQKLMADTKTDKEIAENLFEISKQILKELAEDFQLIDNEFKILVDQILEFNMPDRPNPLQSWHELNDPKMDLHIDEFTGEKLPSTPKALTHFAKGMAKTGKSINILKHSQVYNKILKTVKHSYRNENNVRFKLLAKKPVKMVNDSLVKKAIEETDCNLNLNVKDK